VPGKNLLYFYQFHIISYFLIRNRTCLWSPSVLLVFIWTKKFCWSCMKDCWAPGKNLPYFYQFHAVSYFLTLNRTCLWSPSVSLASIWQKKFDWGCMKSCWVLGKSFPYFCQFHVIILFSHLHQNPFVVLSGLWMTASNGGFGLQVSSRSSATFLRSQVNTTVCAFPYVVPPLFDIWLLAQLSII
jgi:hypothetical protein